MENNIFTGLKKNLPGVQKNILLAPHTTFHIGGPAKYFFIAREKKSLIKAITVAKKLHMPVFVLGGGSNLLVSDKGFTGLVVKIQLAKWRFEPNNAIVSDAGVMMQSLVGASVKNGMAGLEWAGGLPGTLGGAIRGNAGAFGGEMKDSILQVGALENHLNYKTLSNKQCQFSYRSSIFKEKNLPVISAKIQLKKGDKKNLQAIANSHIEYRKEKHPLEYPNAGSVFKNVDVKRLSSKFQKLFSDKVKKDPFEIVPSAWFIIGAGLSGKTIGQAQISEKHSNYIINLGGAKAKDVLSLIAFARKAVKKKYGIDLEQEIQYLD